MPLASSPDEDGPGPTPGDQAPEQAPPGGGDEVWSDGDVPTVQTDGDVTTVQTAGDGELPGPAAAVPPDDELPVAPPPPADEPAAPPVRWLRNRPLVVAGFLVACLVLALALGVGRGTGPRPGAEPSPGLLSAGATQGQAAPRRTEQNEALDRRAALTTLLRQRGEAVLGRNKASWLASVDPSQAGFRKQQSVVFDRLRQLPLAAWRYQVLQDEPALGSVRQARLGPTAWVSTVELSYRFKADAVAIRRIERLTARQVAGHWLIAADTDGATDRDLWDLTPISVRKGSRSVVVGASSQARNLTRFAKDVDVAARNVDKAWGTAWPRTVVVLVPDSLRQMAQLLGRENTDGLDQLAAVTTGEVRRAGDVLARPTGTADRVVLNPQAFGSEFGQAGRRLVLTHELVHVATRSAAWCSPPIWVEEGFADFVAYRTSGLSRERIASELVAAVRLGRAPAHLPSSEDFDPARNDVAQAYAGAWLAFDMMARAGGADRAVEFYRSAAGIERHGHPPAKAPQVLEQAYADVLGVDGATFERKWRDYVAAVAVKSSR